MSSSSCDKSPASCSSVDYWSRRNCAAASFFALRQTDLPCAHVEAYSLFLLQRIRIRLEILITTSYHGFFLILEVLEDFHHVLLAAKIRGHAVIVPQHLSLRQTDLPCAHVEAYSLYLEEFLIFLEILITTSHHGFFLIYRLWKIFITFLLPQRSVVMP